MEAGNCHVPYECMYESCRNWNSVAVAWEQVGGAWTKTGQKRAQLWRNSLQPHCSRPFSPSLFSFPPSFLTVVSVFSFVSFFSSLPPPPGLGIKTRVLFLLVLYHWTASPASGVEFPTTWEILVTGSFGKQLVVCRVVDLEISLFTAHPNVNKWAK